MIPGLGRISHILSVFDHACNEPCWLQIYNTFIIPKHASPEKACSICLFGREATQSPDVTIITFQPPKSTVDDTKTKTSHLSRIFEYGGGGPEGIAEELPSGFCTCGIEALILAASKSERLKFKNSCLFVHCCWLAANPSLFSGTGGGSVILVTRYAVEASAIPYIRTPSSGIRWKT